MASGPSEELLLHYNPHITHLWPAAQLYQAAVDIPDDAEVALFKREKNSHRGISTKQELWGLSAASANQEFIEEIGELENLEYLELGWPMTATDLSPLKHLSQLKYLRIDSPRNIDDFSPLVEIPRLERLVIENAKHLTDLEWVRPLAKQLKVFGIEGSINSTQHIDSLSPLADFELEALLITSTRLADQSLRPLRNMKSLRLLATALNAPRAEFDALKESLPGLECYWFGPASWEGVRDPRNPRNKK